MSDLMRDILKDEKLNVKENTNITDAIKIKLTSEPAQLEI